MRYNFFLLLSVILVNFFSINKLNAGFYEDVFTPDIYDQSTRAQQKFTQRRHRDYSKKESNVDLTKHPVEEEIARLVWPRTSGTDSERTCISTLYFQKLLCVEEKFVGNIRNQIQCLEGIKTNLKNANAQKGGASALSGLIGAGIELVTNWTLSPIGALSRVGSKLLGHFSSTSAQNNDDLVKHGGEIDKGIQELKLEIQKYQNGVFCEPIKDLEEKYIFKKKLIKEDLQYTIENNLINSRKPLYPFPFIKQCIEEALNLPTEHKKLVTETLLTKFRNENFFKSFKPSTKTDLESTIVSIAQYSKKEPVGEIPVRGIYYFWGAPGIGKSRTAQELSKLMGLPFWRCSIRGASDLSQENLEGSSCLGPRANPGWLGSPLLAFEEGDKSKKTYKNSVLILEDFDRILLDEQSGISSLAFILDYFDPLKKSFFSPYFNALIDISRINIVVTGNSPIPEDDEKYLALRERFTRIIEFFPFESKKKSEILTDFAKICRNHYDIPHSELKPNENLALKYVVDSAEELTDNPSSIRSCERSIENIFSNVKAAGWKRAREDTDDKLRTKRAKIVVAVDQ